MKTLAQARQSKSPSCPRGFALIVTLSLMILLTVVAVGLLTLSSISLRSSTQGQAMQTARANARLALILALGDLQKSLGPDKRISARAETLAKDSRVGSPPAANTPEAWWVGVSDSDGKTPVESGEAVKWLVSGQPTSKLAKLANPVDMIKGGSLDLAQFTGGAPIQAGLIPIKNAAGTITGNFAYLVDDEGMKAQLAASHPDVRNDNDEVTAGVLPGTHPLSKLRNLTGGSTGDVALVQKLGSSRDLALIGVSPATTREKFFAYTTRSQGVLCDSRAGGLKKDLTLAFETPAVFSVVFPKTDPEKYIAITPEKLASASDLRDNGYINWAIFRDFYNLKKNIQTKDGIDYLEMSVFANWGFSNTKSEAIKKDPFYTGSLGPHAMKGTEAFHKDMPYTPPPATDASIKGRKFLQYQSNPIFPLLLEVYEKCWLQTNAKSDNNPVEGAELDSKKLLANTQVFTSHYNPYNVGIYAAGIKDNVINNASGLRILKYPQVLLDVQATGGSIFTASSRATHSDDTNNTNGGDLSTFQPKLTAAVLENTQRGIKGAMMLLPGHSHVIGMGDNRVKGKTADGNIYTDKVSDSVNKSAFLIRETKSDTAVGSFTVVTEFAMSEPAMIVGAEASPNDTGFDPEASQVFFALLAKDAVDSFDRVPTSEKRPGKIFTDTLSRTQMQITKAKTVQIALRTTNEISKGLRPLMDANIRAQWNNPKWDSSMGLDGLAAYSYKYTGDANDPPPSFLETAVAPDNRQGYSMWGAGRQQGTGGSDTVILFDVPRRDLVSLGQLQHAAAGRFSYEPSYIVGNSYANPRIPLGDWKESASDSFSTSGRGLSQWKIGGNFNLYDASYLVNELLWDSYTFTTIPQVADNRTGGDVTVADYPALLARTKQLPNPRYVPYEPEGSEFTAANLQAVGTATTGSFFENAGHLLVDGSFNVNSTSVDAWEAFLSSTLDLPVLKLDPATGKIDKFEKTTGVRYPRAAMPSGNGMKTASLDDKNYWTGFRELTDAEVKNIAKEIVAHIKDRGPFLTLGAFVNRKLGSDKNARSGALQAALDNTVNKGLDSSFQSAVDSAVVKTAPENSNQGSGFPGQLLQGDVLQVLGPYMTVHSDTFTIRAYGEAKNGNIVTARAYCEAVVQRFPDPVKTKSSSSSPSSELALPSSPFGRQFSIISFRWLHDAEI